MSKTSALTKFLDRFWYLKQAWAIFKTKYLDLAALEVLTWVVMLLITLVVIAMSGWLLNGLDILDLTKVDINGFGLRLNSIDSAKDWLITVRNTHSATYWQLLLSVPVLLTLGLITFYTSVRTIALLVVIESNRNQYWSKFKTLLSQSFWPLVLASFVSGLIVLAGLTLFIVPGVWLALSFMFLPYFIVLGKLAVWPSIVASTRQLKRSFRTVVELMAVYFMFGSLVDSIFQPNSSSNLSMLLNALTSWILSLILMLSLLSIYRQSAESKTDEDLIVIKADSWIKWAKALTIIGVIVLLGITVLINFGTDLIFNTDYIGSK
ncbi:MAG: hypothetical protein CEO22_213 [Candidatus Berkelbacteria bacterium Gr01-1014_85]|uniref:Uncharacterized protein n=1 Tax=Candidatus Berkelbacteria bacterium Gr01-1014_85 TaxID=2017150 RepID=A0A554JCP8_9BACT|nr:MAG: hypothetical protein CEO22_213 [Candidatus Berkelbacteria bacterium Gr01-1014_85]